MQNPNYLRMDGYYDTCASDFTSIYKMLRDAGDVALAQGRAGKDVVNIKAERDMTTGNFVIQLIFQDKRSSINEHGDWIFPDR